MRQISWRIVHVDFLHTMIACGIPLFEANREWHNFWKGVDQNETD